MTKDRKDAKRVVVPRSIPGFVGFIFKEILRQKKWLLIPLWILLAAIALVIFLGGGSSLLPAIYIAF